MLMKKIFTLLAAVLFGGAMFANAQVSTPVTVSVGDVYYYPDYDDATTYETKSIKSFEAVLEIAEDGTYTLKNVLGTEYSISFKVGEYSGQTAPLSFVGNIKVDKGYETYPYFLTPSNKYMTVKPVEKDGTVLTVNYFAGDENVKYTNIYKCTDEEITEGYYEYYVDLCTNGNIGDKGYIDMTLSFGFDMPKSGVANVAVDADAPVEYYNLQGVKVANPSNGIFVRRQGSEVKKVIIK